MDDPTTTDAPLAFHTERLLLRSYLPGDGSWWFEMIERNRGHLARSMPEPLLSISGAEEAEAHLRRLEERERGHRGYVFAVFRNADNAFCGEVSAMLVSDSLAMYELGYFAEQGMQGQGYVSEALAALRDFCFRELHAHKLILACDPLNAASVRVAEKAGFLREGLRRRHVVFEDGTLADAALYGLLAEDWQRLPGATRPA